MVSIDLHLHSTHKYSVGAYMPVCWRTCTVLWGQCSAVCHRVDLQLFHWTIHSSVESTVLQWYSCTIVETQPLINIHHQLWRERVAPVCRVVVGVGFLSSGHHPASRATNAQLTPAECSSFFLYFLLYVLGARCVPKRITYTVGAFSIV